MLKAINCAPYDENPPNDRGDFQGVREFARTGGAQAVVVWAPGWRQYEPRQGEFDESRWGELDRQVQFAHEDNLKTFVVVPSSTPDWAIPVAGKRLAPSNRSPQGPWAGYLLKVLLRHPKVQGIIVMNEPNPTFADELRPGHKAGQMLLTAAEIWKATKATPRLMGPGTLDGPGALTFSREVFETLGPHWAADLARQGVHVGHAWHPYTEVTRGVIGANSQLNKVLDLQYLHHRPLGEGIWLTEGGYHYSVAGGPPPFPDNYRYTDLEGDERRQLDHVVRHYRWCQLSKKVHLWANYEYRDSLWGGWASGFVRHDGTHRRLHDIWKKL